MDKKYLMLFLIVGIFSLIIFSGATTLVLNYFNNSLTSENLTFTGNENITRYLEINKDANIVYSVLTISNSSGLVWEIDEENQSNYSGVDMSYGDRAFDENLSTTSYCWYGPCWWLENTSWTYPPTHWLSKFSVSQYTSESFNITCYNYSSSSYVEFYSINDNSENTYTKIILLPSGCVSTSPLLINSTHYGNSGINQYYYEGKLQNRSNISNSFIKINNTLITTDTDFTSTLNTALNSGVCDCVGCSLSGNNCSIPFIFHSNTMGILEYSAINITWNESVSPNLTITTPTANQQFSTRTPNFVISTADNYQIDYCQYNITRGASLEVANTNISNCATFTPTLSSDASYVLNVKVVDMFGNVNISSANFSVDTGVVGGSSSGGASGTVVIIGQDVSWTMETEQQTSFYDLLMIDGSIRTKSIYFNNNGTTIVNLDLRCEGDLCAYIKLEDIELDLPPGVALKTKTDITIDLTAGLEDGEYTANIIAKDQEGNEGLISIDVNVGEFNALTEIFEKLKSSRAFGDTMIPYILIMIAVFISLEIVFILILIKVPGGIAFATIIAFVGSFISMLFF